MKSKNIMATLFLSLFCGLSVLSIPGQAASAEQTLLATTFPIYQILRNVAKGREGVLVELMLPSQMGCPHDYMLTPQDMKKLARADLLVVNGLGMEEFLGAPVKKANPKIKVIDSSVGITDLIQYTQEPCCHEHHHGEGSFEWTGAYQLNPGLYQWSLAKVAGQYADPAMKMTYVKTDARDPIEACEHQASEMFAQEGQPLLQGGCLRGGQLHLLQFDDTRDITQFTVKIDEAGTYVFFTEHLPAEFAAEHGFKTADGQVLKPMTQESNADHHHHHHSGPNPHLFASPRMAARLALNIAAGLAQADPQGATVYQENARAYAQTLNRLADDMVALGRRLKNNRIVEPHGIFDYLARDMGLEIVAVTQAHGQEPSAAEMVQLVKTIRDQDAGAIFTEPQYSDKVGRVLAREAGIPVGVLDPVATGPQRTPLNYYETAMRENMETLRTTLGVK